ncbi:MAG: tRNA (adenosine(37)-N6)-threonylcarbamoyltransferase complex ATPase subunit type 1 TsaE [Candidatus Nomurabacteria bacterium]|nr:tRNA (adenosine(37)-N6)-threonylcarbamoyltransferase complex ATPase subunit type 1 TsaE [Candidatus Nomurabacteria bacterium]
MEKEINSLDELLQFASEFIANLKPNSDNATVIALQGDLGAGKTTFTQMVAGELGVTETVNSPTFVIIKKYPIAPLKPSPQMRGGGDEGRRGINKKEEDNPNTPQPFGQPPYIGGQDAFTTLIHIDAYRLDNGNDLMKLDFQRELDNPQNLIIIEWPEIVADALPENTKTIEFTWIDETTRKIKTPE